MQQKSLVLCHSGQKPGPVLLGPLFTHLDNRVPFKGSPAMNMEQTPQRRYS